MSRTPSATFASSHTRNLWDHRSALAEDVIKPAAMATLFAGMVGDIGAKWLPQTPLTMAGIAISGATTWSYLREFLSKLPEVRA